MNFHVMTLFPDMIKQGMNTSILGRAMEKGLIHLQAVDIRDFSENRHKRVDDYPYGGGAGLVMAPGPVVNCYHSIMKDIKARESQAKVIYLTPQGQVFHQKMAEELSKEQDLIFLCGHYEGIDERAIELIATDYVSIGDYVLTGGELPAMVMMDAIARLIPGVLHNDSSSEFESLKDNLLEYPQYTRPFDYQGKKVPEVLLSGHHEKIEKWRREQSIIRTLERRPDLMEEAVLSEKEKEFLQKYKME